jgi:diguanylate cyclase (GGDEF)-like protein
MYLPLILSAAGALGILPFAVIRWLDGDWIIAAIDTLIIIGFVCLGTYVYRSRNVRVASIALSFLGVGGVLATVYARGPDQAYWAYPAAMLLFYLLRPREAVLATLLMIAILLPKIVPTTDTFRATTIIMTIIVTSVFAYAFSVINDRQRADLVDLAIKDPLTGAGNRRALEQRMKDLIARAKREAVRASLILIDLDHFKSVNDAHGHAAGDQILCRLTDIVNLRIRTTDDLYRIGGEEFVVVVEGLAFDATWHLAEQLRTLVEANELVPDRSVTISVGVAELQEGETVDRWLNRADEALYEAKRAGRNTIRRAS